MKSWKTTVGGILLALAPIAGSLEKSWSAPAATILGALGALLLGVNARDNDKSSEDVGASK